MPWSPAVTLSIWHSFIHRSHTRRDKDIHSNILRTTWSIYLRLQPEKPRSKINIRSTLVDIATSISWIVIKIVISWMRDNFNNRINGTEITCQVSIAGEPPTKFDNDLSKHVRGTYVNGVRAWRKSWQCPTQNNLERSIRPPQYRHQRGICTTLQGQNSQSRLMVQDRDAHPPLTNCTGVRKLDASFTSRGSTICLSGAPANTIRTSIHHLQTSVGSTCD